MQARANGVCSGQIDGFPCDLDGNPCTLDTCQSQVCTAGSNAPDNTPCADATVCNGDETCQSGTCTAGTALVCDDGNVCNGTETCDPVAGCQAGTALVCDDGNVCTDDSCDPQTGCVNAANSLPCNDGEACTTDDTCQNTQCVGAQQATACQTFGGGGGTLSTGGAATPQDPVTTSVTSPNGGTVLITEGTPSGPLPGFTVLGQQVNISAPPASVSDPLIIVIRLDASLIPPGTDPFSIQLFKDGVLVPPCTGAPAAIPDPCISNKVVLPDGDIEFTVLSSTASAWNFASAVCGNHTVEAGEQCDDGNTVNGDGCSSTCQNETCPTCPAIDLVQAAGRAGVVACLGARLLAQGNTVVATSNDVGLQSTPFELTTCMINPAIGPSTTPNATLHQSMPDANTERFGVFSDSYTTNPIPDGGLFGCTISIPPGTADGTYYLSNMPDWSDLYGGNTPPAGGAAARLAVGSCTGDCDGNGEVRIGEIVKVINLYLGFPLCNLPFPDRSCPMAATSGGAVPIGQVVLTVNGFL